MRYRNSLKFQILPPQKKEKKKPECFEFIFHSVDSSRITQLTFKM